MKKVLLTGGTGFIGRNISPILKEQCLLFMPSRQELDLKDEQAVRRYLTEKEIDAVLHFANPNPVKNSLDQMNTMLQDSLRVYMNLYNCRELYGRMFYLGSGAEYDKSLEIRLIEEGMVGRSMPKDEYGFSKVIMNELARSSENIYNLRIFGCYGPTDHESKFITHVIRCCLKEEDITIRQNCYFDYMQVRDLAYIILRLMDRDLEYHDYNVCTAKRTTLAEIAEIVKAQMHSSCEIRLLSEGWNREYTGSNARLLGELGEAFAFTSLEEGIKIQIESERMAVR